MRVSSVSGSLLLLAAAMASVVVCGAPQALKLRQSVAVPRNWLDLGRAPPAHVIPLRIALPQQRFSELEQHLAEISDPFHARYGKHLSKADVEALVAPHPNSVNAVYEWLEGHGFRREVCHQSPAGDWVTVRVPVAQAEEMLGTVRAYYTARRMPADSTSTCSRSSECGNTLWTVMSSCARRSTACLNT